MCKVLKFRPKTCKKFLTGSDAKAESIFKKLMFDSDKMFLCRS